MWQSQSHNHIKIVVEKTKKNIQKVGKTSQTINYASTPWLKHDKIWAQWVLSIMLKNMLKMI